MLFINIVLFVCVKTIMSEHTSANASANASETNYWIIKIKPLINALYNDISNTVLNDTETLVSILLCNTGIISNNNLLHTFKYS